MEKCRRMTRPQFMSKTWTYSWQWKSSRTRQQCYRSESFAMKTGIPTNGSTVKNHISLWTKFGLFATLRTSFLSWFQACQVLPLDLHNFKDTCETEESFSPSSPTVDDLFVRSRTGRCDSQWHLSSVSVWICWWQIREFWGNPSQQNPENK